MKKVLIALLAMCATALADHAQAQEYPSRPVRMLVGYAAGGGADGLARILAQRLGTELGQQFVVDNRPGAGGTIAAEALAKALPDGYTLYFADTAILIAPVVQPKLGFDPAKAFTPVGSVCSLPLVIVANLQAPAQTVQDIIAYATANPGKLSYGSPGIGTVQHLAMELFKSRAGVDIVHVPYKGASPILPDLLSGQIPLAVISAAPALAQARSGKLKPVALTTAGKFANAPDWPAVADSFPGFDAAPKLFVIAPGATPAPVVQRLSGAMKATLASAEVIDAMGKQGATVRWSSPDAFAAELVQESEIWLGVARTAGLKPE